MKKSLFEKKTDILSFIMLILFFGFCLIKIPMTELEDSFQYLTQLPSRDPVYAFLLWGLQKLFSDYTLPLSLIQNGLGIVGTYWLYMRLNKLFDFKNWQRPFIMLALLAPHLLTPLASQSHMVITCSVLTEGIGLSLYYIWAGMILSHILGYYGQKNGRALIITLLMSCMMAMIRGQFMICVAVWLLAMIYVMIKSGEWKKILLYFCIMIACYAGQTMLTKCYHYAMSDVFTSTVASKPMLLSNIIYVAEESDAELIEDARLKQAFLKMLDDSKERGLTIENASGNIIDRARFHESGHEEINFDCVTMELNELIYELENADESCFENFLVYRDKYADMLIKSSFKQVLPRYVSNYFVISSLGFVRSVAIEKGPLVYYAVLVYLFAIAASLFLFVKNRNSRAAVFMTMVLVSICGTVFGTSLLIECLSRYMIYNLPLFYIALLVVLNEMVTVLRKKKSE